MIELPARTTKPRSLGITAITDVGVPLDTLTNVLNSYSAFLDVAKFGVGSAYIEPKLREKLAVYKSHDVECYFGGTLFEKFYSNNLVKGLTATCNGFYAFQGRKTRIPAESLINLEKLNRILFKNHKVTNLEMETAIIYGLSDFLGHNAISLNAILANRVNNLYSKKPNEIIESLIRYALKKI